MTTMKRLFEMAGLDNLLTSAEQLWNQRELEAYVAACALMAFADGVVTEVEKKAMIEDARQISFLRAFEVRDIGPAFTEALDKLRNNTVMAELDLYRAIGKIDELNTARVILASVCKIGASDGNFDAKEIKIAFEIADALKVPRNRAEDMIARFSTDNGRAVSIASGKTPGGWVIGNTTPDAPAAPAPAPAAPAAAPALPVPSQTLGGWVVGGTKTDEKTAPNPSAKDGEKASNGWVVGGPTVR